MFMERWCRRCERDRAFRESLDEEGIPAGFVEGCPILAASMAFDVGEDGYPKEWVYDPDVMLRDGALTIGEGGARCTAFEREGE